jgi:NADPH2:quinone reductase
MKAILCTRFGTPDDLELGELPDPVAGAGEVVVRVPAAALNFFDTLIIAGKYQFRPAFPFSPAAEFSGVVESLGAGVSSPAVGDRVMGFIGWGAARERVTVRADKLVPIPPGLDFEKAAGLPCIYGTAYYALRERAGLKRGETLAVLGAAGGIGMASVELGKLMGARVIACASSDEKLAFARDHGADETVNYDKEDLKDALRQLTDGRGVDVVCDPVGGAYSEAALRAMAWEGRFLVVGFTSGEIPKIPLNLVLLKGCDIRGVFWGEWLSRDLPAHRADTAQIARWCAEGKLSGHVQAVYPLAETAQALKDIAARKVMGKIVLRM